MTPPTRIFPTDICPMLASTTARDEGGMSMANPPTPMIGPTDMGVLYPRRLISGSKTVPSMAVLARVEPLKAAKRTPAPVASRLNRPGSRPSHLSITSMVLLAIPE